MSAAAADQQTALGVVVLCGGRSRRMGRSKAWLPFAGETLLQQAVRRAAEVGGRVVVVAAPGQLLPTLPASVELLRDPVADRGPLQGLAVGLQALAPEIDLAFVTATDTPFMSPPLMRRVVALCRGHRAAVPQVHGRLHPLAAAYATALHTRASALLDAGERRLRRLLELTDARRLDTELLLADAAVRAVDPELRGLCNVNDEQAYRAALGASDGASKA